MKKIGLLLMLMLGVFIGGCSTNTVSASTNEKNISYRVSDIQVPVSPNDAIYDREELRCVNGHLIWVAYNDGGYDGGMTSQIVGSCEMK